ncbi:MAG: immunoglobulin domain-containing protein [Verrucomicrobia bacterium]|nr:immunoglobulin domain-containing protein [Verrucomicrobiota bacterium]
MPLKAADLFNTPPTITSQPTGAVVQVGGSVIFAVRAIGSFPLEFQWLRNGVRISGATQSSFGVYSVRPEDAANYQVIISNPYGTVTSAIASLTVLTPLLITKNPASQVAKAGEDVTFTVEATSKLTLNYLWFRDGNLIPGSATSVLTLKSVQHADAGSYTAQVYTMEGGLRSLPATLTIIGALPPLITTQPVSQSSFVGTNATFFVAVSGGRPFGYQWFKNGLAISNAFNSNLTFNVVRESDAGSYHCVVTNRAGTATSASASLVVLAPPSITVQPTNKIAFAGTTVTFSAEAKGVPAPAYRWFKNGEPIPNAFSSSLLLNNVQPADNGSYHVVASNLVGLATSQIVNLAVHVPASIKTQPLPQNVFVGAAVVFSVEANGEPPLAFQWFKGTSALLSATNAVLVFTNAQLADAGSYSVVVSNAFARVVSVPAILTVNYPVTITSQPASQAVLLGSNAVFTVAATAFGGGLLGYQWSKDGVFIPTARTAELRLRRVQTSDAGDYQAIVSGTAGAATSAVAQLTVNVPASIRAQPQSQTVPVGATARFTADVVGTLPLLFRWLKNDVMITNTTAALLEFDIKRYAEPANYRFIVMNAFGSATSTVARLTITGPPEITIQPLSHIAVVGSSVSFLVEAFGNSPLNYQWLKNDQPMAGATNWILILRNLQLSDASVYRVIVSNVYGNAESVGARLSVGLHASISLQPANRTARIGESVTFSVASPNEPPVNYQWFKDGVIIPDATNATFTLNAVKRLDAGKYAASVSTPFGQARSAEATLAIRVNPTKGDLSGDGIPDIVFQDENGLLAFWEMNGTDLSSADLLIPGAIDEPGWRIVGSSDFDRDGYSDLALQHREGKLAVWFMKGRRLISGMPITVGLTGFEEWKVVGTGDFNRDEKPDLFVQDHNGRLAAWLVNDLAVESTALLDFGNPVDLNWNVVGVDDFNEDGRADVVFQHKNGTLAVWYLDKFATASPALFSPSTPGDPQWQAVGVTDRNGDGEADILFQHQKDGTLAVWFLNGIKLSQAQLLNPSRPGGSWRVVAPK